MTASNLRSSVYMEIFPDDEMIEAFGHLQPSLSERNAYFFDKWMEWRANRMKIRYRETSRGIELNIKNTCKNIGLRDDSINSTKVINVRYKKTRNWYFWWTTP